MMSEEELATTCPVSEEEAGLTCPVSEEEAGLTYPCVPGCVDSFSNDTIRTCIPCIITQIGSRYNITLHSYNLFSQSLSVVLINIVYQNINPLNVKF